MQRFERLRSIRADVRIIRIEPLRKDAEATRDATPDTPSRRRLEDALHLAHYDDGVTLWQFFADHLPDSLHGHRQRAVKQGQERRSEH